MMKTANRAPSVSRAYVDLASEVDGAFPWVDGRNLEEAVDRARAAQEAWELELEGQAYAQLREVCKLALRDYLLRHGARVMFEDRVGYSYPLETARLVIPARLLILANRLRGFPLEQYFDFEAARAAMTVLVTEGGDYYLRFPWFGEVCLID
jgi:hypothetical protein